MDPLHSLQGLALVLLALCLYHTSHSMNVRPQKEIYLPDYHIYHNLSSINHKLSSLKHQVIQIDKTYKSRHKRTQYVIHITNSSNTKPKPKILLVSGQHAREFFPVESLLHLIRNISKGLNSKKDSAEYQYSNFLVNYVDLYIVVMLNPDGRQYIENKGNYCWRGTATGVDLERNFDWNYGGKGSSSNADDEEYRGTEAFSEPECHVILDLTENVQFDAFISLHSGARQIFVPFSDSKSKKLVRRPANEAAMLKLAAILSEAPSGVDFSSGTAATLLEYSSDGTMFDYMAGVRKIPFSLTVELWGRKRHHETSSCFDMYNPKSHDLKSAIHAVHPIYESLFSYMVRWKRYQLRRRGYLALRNDEPSLTLGLILLCLVIGVTLFYTIQHKLPFWLHVFPRRRIVSLRTLSSTFYPYKPSSS